MAAVRTVHTAFSLIAATNEYMRQAVKDIHMRTPKINTLLRPKIANVTKMPNLEIMCKIFKVYSICNYHVSKFCVF